MSGFGYNVLGFGANASGGGPVVPSDDQFNRVSFLSHFEGSNNGVNNAFDDGSTSNHTITANGDVTQGSFGPFARPDGEWGVLLGDNNRLTVPATTDFDFGTGDFTVEFFVFPTARTGTLEIFCSAGAIGAGTEVQINMGIYSGGHGLSFYRDTGYVIQTAQTTANLTVLNEWNHIALSRESGTVSLYLNKTRLGTASNTANINFSGLTIGAYMHDGNYEANGTFSNFRFVKGSAVYDPTSTTLTVPTSKLTAITNTVLLTCQSNRFVDNSASAHTITPAGTAAVTAFGPFLNSAVYDAAVNGASAYFDGDGDSLVLADSSDFELGSGDFTIAMWVYPDDLTPPSRAYNNIALMMHSTYYGTAVGWSMFWQTASPVTNCFRFMVNGTSRIYDAEGFFGRQWTYLTAVRTGDTLKLFINGVEKVSTSFADFSNSTTTLTIGASPNWQSDVYKFDGKMSDVFICKGTAVYTSAFTPPTAPLTAITNTKLLLNMKDGQAIDSAAQNNLTLINDAKTSNTRAKFGDTSLYLDGSDYAIIDNSQSRAFGTGDFTVELFIWLNGSPDIYDYIFDMRSSSDLSYTWALSFNYMATSSDKLQWCTNVGNTANLILNADYPSLNQWVHIAVCRSGTTSRMFYDGTQVAINTSDTYDYRDTGYQGYIGCRHSIEHYIDAYMDEIRFSKTARYTSNFTAPTEPFADKGQ